MRAYAAPLRCARCGKPIHWNAKLVFSLAELGEPIDATRRVMHPDCFNRAVEEGVANPDEWSATW